MVIRNKKIPDGEVREWYSLSRDFQTVFAKGPERGESSCRQRRDGITNLKITDSKYSSNVAFTSFLEQILSLWSLLLV